MVFHIFTYIFTIYVLSDQLPVGLIAQLVGHRSWVWLPSSLNFPQPLISELRKVEFINNTSWALK